MFAPLIIGYGHMVGVVIGRRSNNVIMMVAARGYKNISSKLFISLPNTKKKILLVGDVSIDYQFNFFFMITKTHLRFT